MSNILSCFWERRLAQGKMSFYNHRKDARDHDVAFGANCKCEEVAPRVDTHRLEPGHECVLQASRALVVLSSPVVERLTAVDLPSSSAAVCIVRNLPISWEVLFTPASIKMTFCLEPTPGTVSKSSSIWLAMKRVSFGPFMRCVSLRWAIHSPPPPPPRHPSHQVSALWVKRGRGCHRLLLSPCACCSSALPPKDRVLNLRGCSIAPLI
jgi:hypothetical protein